MKLIEMFTCSKAGKEDLNEDAVYFGENIVAVIDGVTSKSGKTIDGIAEGRFAAQTLLKLLDDVDAQLSPFEIISFLSEGLRKEASKKNYPQKPSAVVTIYNNLRKELFSYGDCPYKIGNQDYKNAKDLDREIAKKRASIIKDALKKGATIEDIRKNDIGRKAIVPELVGKTNEKANFLGEGGFPVVNGDKPIKEYIVIHKILPNTQIVITSDGYPKILSTLSATEDNLLELLKKDPLCIEELCGTKCVAEGNVSYDDRSYIRFLTE